MLFSSPQAAILQQTAEYIFTLEQEKTRLLQQNSQLKRIIQVKYRHSDLEALLLFRIMMSFVGVTNLFSVYYTGIKWLFPQKKACRGEG